MRTWLRWAIVACLALLLAPVAPARAAFGDCATREYLASFDPRYGDPASLYSIDCVERLRVPVETNSGTRHIRIIHDFSADWIADDTAMANFERGVRSAADAIRQLGGVDLEDVTVFLADDFPPREDADTFSDIAALTENVSDGECRIIVYLAGPASRSRFSAWVVAHEIFHCVQSANLTDAQNATGSIGEGGGGDWWIEGSASWFAALAVAEPGPLPLFVRDFDEASATTPLNEMAYGASVFFLWLGAEVEPRGVMAFLRGMADSRDAPAQRAAMTAALPQERWLDFAEAYLDGEIRHPHGADLRMTPTLGEVWSWSATRAETLTLEPFVLTRGVVAFECGHWRTEVTPSAMHATRPEDGGDWSPLPSEISTTSGSGGNYRFVAMNATASRATMRIVGTMEAGCGDCAGVVTLDACVVGSWQLTGGGPVEWMRRQGVPGNYSASNQTITFRADGTFVTGVVQGSMDVERGDTRGEGEMSAQAGGRWSTNGGVLNLCADMQAMSGQVRIITPRGSGRAPLGPAPPTNSSERYTCAGASLNTERDIPGSSPMPFQYTRIGGG